MKFSVSSHPWTRRRWLATGFGAACAGRLWAETATTEPWRIDMAQVTTPQFEGWGVSLAWWAKLAGELPDEDFEWLMRKIFHPGDGIGLNLVRYNIGGGENPKHHFLSYRAAIDGFCDVSGEWNWQADAGQRKVLRRARELGVNLFEAFSNSPPWWMTQSGSVTGDGEGRGNLKPEAIDEFARYLAAVLKHFREVEKVDFRTLAPLNEPLGYWWKWGGPQEGCVIQPEQQGRLIVACRAALDRLNLATGVSGPETNNTNSALRSLRAYPKQAWEGLMHVNTHTYHAQERRELRELATEHGKQIHVSEYGDHEASGMRMARVILSDLRELRARSWTHWQAVDWGGWGLLDHPAFNHHKHRWSSVDIREARVNGKFHVLRLFARCLPAGCQVIAGNSEHGVAGFDPKSRVLGCVFLNDSPSEVEITLELAGGLLKGKQGEGELTGGGEAKALAPLRMEGESQKLTVPARSLLGLRVMA